MHTTTGTTNAGTHWSRSGTTGTTPVVLIHGLGLSMATWDRHVPALAEKHDVLRYDLLGHGQSGPQPADLSLTTFGAQLVDLLTELAIDQAHLVGFSLGGMINRRVAIDHPDRVASLCILNSPHARGAEAQRLVEQRAIDSAAGGPAATIDATLERWFTPGFRHANSAVVDWVREVVLANDLHQYAAARWVLANGVTELIEPDPALTHPTLVMTCENDSGSTPVMSETICAEIRNSHLDIVADLQHLGLLEDPDRFTRSILDFLATA